MREGDSDLDRVLKSWRWQAYLFGALGIITLVLLIVSVIGLIDHPGTTVATCVLNPHSDHLSNCVVVSK